ncbi:MAG: hypothetical protein CMH31_03715 [Micavibrio sp.]|nr:hypothetical protein [Micavibrio sp.]
MPEELPYIDAKKLLALVEKTSEELRDLLETPDLVLRLALTPDEEIRQDFSKQWAANRDGFHWGTYLDRLQNITNKFVIAAYAGETLAGLCLYSLPEKHPKRLQIQAIEGKQENNPLKGYITPIFNEIALGAAKTFALAELSVVWPESNTIRRHTRLLDYVSSGNDLIVSVSESTSVNWDAQFSHQASKSLFVPTHAR